MYCWMRNSSHFLAAVHRGGTGSVYFGGSLLFRPDYELDIADQELKDIGIANPHDALVFAIVTIPADGSPMTANLQGPW